MSDAQALQEVANIFAAEKAADEAATAPAVEAAPEVEAPAVAEVEPAVAEEDKRFAAKFAALSRKEKEIRTRERQLEARIKDLESKAAATPAVPVKEALETRIKRDPFNTLKELGVDYQTLTQIALNDGKLTPELQMDLLRQDMETKYSSKLDEITKRLETKDKEAEQQRDTAIITNFKAEIAEEVKADPEKYELVGSEGEYGIEMVFEIINSHYDETGDVMSTEEALQKVEENLLNEAKKRIELKKIKSLLNAPSVIQAKAKDTKASMTLSNQNTQAQPTKTSHLSEEDALREVAKLIKWDN